MFLQWLCFLQCNSSAVNAIKMCMKWSMSGRIGVTKVSRWPGEGWGGLWENLSNYSYSPKGCPPYHLSPWDLNYYISHDINFSFGFSIECALIKSNKSTNLRSPYLFNWHYMDISFSFIIKKLLMAKRFIAKSWSIKDDGAELVLRCILS